MKDDYDYDLIQERIRIARELRSRALGDLFARGWQAARSAVAGQWMKLVRAAGATARTRSA